MVRIIEKSEVKNKGHFDMLWTSGLIALKVDGNKRTYDSASLCMMFAKSLLGVHFHLSQTMWYQIQAYYETYPYTILVNK